MYDAYLARNEMKKKQRNREREIGVWVRGEREK